MVDRGPWLCWTSRRANFESIGLKTCVGMGKEREDNEKDSVCARRIFERSRSPDHNDRKNVHCYLLYSWPLFSWQQGQRRVLGKRTANADLNCKQSPNKNSSFFNCFHAWLLTSFFFIFFIFIHLLFRKETKQSAPQPNKNVDYCLDPSFCLVICSLTHKESSFSICRFPSGMINHDSPQLPAICTP